MAGLECSGYALELLKAAGVISGSFDTTAQGLYYLLTDKKRGEELEHPQRGALAFYGAGRDRITHVAFCLDTLYMLEAGGGDSSVKTKTDAEAANAFVRMRPIRARKDLVAFATPYF